ncbi:MAG: Co2+/Mg2+ efflux protein ApaG [Sandaracinaceae bacterium]|nr:Co2+/Mg2+ efflux protein ApaG [Sandaracinaceae bacterium]
MIRPTTSSSAITDGIRVTVTSRYIPEQSVPRLKRFVWAYTIRITNESQVPAKLVSRHWVIVDAADKTEEVRGPGVVGEQPRIEPGKSFQYTSGCVLQTSRGTMRGEYQMLRDDGSQFDAEIAAFALELPVSLN